MTALAEFRSIYERRRTWLKRYLREEGLSQSEFARRAGIDQSTISRVLAGRDVTVDVWLAILEAVGDRSWL